MARKGRETRGAPSALAERGSQSVEILSWETPNTNPTPTRITGGGALETRSAQQKVVAATSSDLGVRTGLC